MTTPSYYVKRLWTKYRPSKDDPAKIVGVDMVEYGSIGSVDKETNVATIDSLKRVRSREGNTDPAVEMANMRWDFIKARWEAWKSGNEMPIDGTPLGAWNVLSPEQAEVFRARGVRTVEEVANLSDAHIERFPFPVRDLIKQARMFIEAADQVRLAQALADRDRKVVDLAEQNEELLARIQALELAAQSPAGDEDDFVEVKPRRGRPPKQAQTEVAA